MDRELFRLSEDEAALVQHYRMLPVNAQAILLLSAELHAEQAREAVNNVVYLTASIKTK